MTIPNLSSAQLRKAAKLKDKIDALQAELNQLLGTPASGNGTAKVPEKRKLSSAARKRIIAAQKARWAKFHAARK